MAGASASGASSAPIPATSGSIRTAKSVGAPNLPLVALPRSGTQGTSFMTINNLRCENVLQPMGVDTPRPRLSWQLASSGRNQKQVSYRVLVASSAQLLAQDRGDLWDSGLVQSDATINIAYAGKPLKSNQRCFWKVQVTNSLGRTTSSTPSFWVTGLLAPGDWHGQWIGYTPPKAAGEADLTLERASWIWFPEGNPMTSAPVARRYFRRAVTIPAGRIVQSARLRVLADNSATIFVNGRQIGRVQDSWKTSETFDIKNALRPGTNVLAFAVTNASDTAANVPNPAGVAAQIDVHFSSGEPLSILSDASWKSSTQEINGWQNADFNEANWVASQVLAPVGQGAWGKIAQASDHALITAPPAPMLRRTFALNGKVKRATAYICGLGYYEMSLNGRKVGDHVLDPGWTRYDRRSLYVTHDVTSHLKNGNNAIGVVLGTGHFDDHVLSVWDFENATWRARPKMLLEMRVEFEDGRQQIITSDSSWKASTGPTTFDSISGGEHYDARLEKAKVNWTQPTYSDASWKAAQVVEPVKGALVAQIEPPIKVTQTLTPIKVSQPTPGVWIFDLGQNFAGVPQLRASAPAGTTVSMRCAEKLHPDGTLDASNIDTFVRRRNPNQAFQTDVYTFKGQGQEVWHPRFTYHGFQYVEVKGFVGTPTLDNLRGIVMHTAFDTAGSFESSNDLLNRTQHNALWSYRSNFHSIPTDCPQREKNGWTADAHLAAEMGLYNFDAMANYEKWLNDIADEQHPDGSFEGIIPTSGWGANIGPAWDSAYPIITWYLYQYRGDKSVVAKHYPHLVRYLDYLSTRAKDGIVDYGLGDWLPAKTQTPNTLTSTSYYYVDATLLAQMARLLGKTDDAAKYDALAASIKKAFNARFYNAQTGQYDKGSLTAQSCALYQGLVEEANKPAVMQALIRELEKQGYHMDTGILGAKYLLNVLVDNGRADLAYRVLQQRTWPSYGYWIDRGATTMWERWTDVGSNDDSRNHIMFGDVSAWFYKYLAGIRAGSPGFKTVILQPHVLGDLTFARASYNSAQGRIESNWTRNGNTFQWQVTVPTNTTATVMVPCAAADQAAITEGGKPIGQVKSIRPLSYKNGYATFSVGSGTYNFASPWRTPQGTS